MGLKSTTVCLGYQQITSLSSATGLTVPQGTTLALPISAPVIPNVLDLEAFLNLAHDMQPSSGAVTLRGVPIERPGPDRMVVFQNYSLLPWKTVEQNVELAVKAARPELAAGHGGADDGEETDRGECREAGAAASIHRQP